jgi:8-oxo-dGTP pyrophosphatase MutT (NUDIX family)
MSWPALAAARAHDASTRVPFVLAGRRVGTVARAHLPALRAWPDWLAVTDADVTLIAPDANAALDGINTGLRAQGLIRAWRDEGFGVFCPTSGERLARMERAASRFWGTLTFGAHANGYLAGPDGRPTHLWIAQRSFTKPTDPGLFDNLVGGGVPDGQTPREALLREGWEEAGLTLDVMQRATPARVLRLHRAIPEGLQFEDLHAFDLLLARDELPHNQDGEVAGFSCLPMADALALAMGRTMTVDAALVTLDFGIRHGQLTAPPGFDALIV